MKSFLLSLFCLLIIYFSSASQDIFNNIGEITIRLYESGDTAVPYNLRVYKTSFVSSETRYINTEFYVKNLLYGKKKQSFDLQWVWQDTMLQIKGDGKGKMEIQPDWKYAYNSNGYGSSTKGSFWKIGKYTAVVYADNKLAGYKTFYVVPDEYKNIEVDESLWNKISSEIDFKHAQGFLKCATPQLAVPFLSFAANKGHGMAQYYLGYYCLNGQLGTQDEKCAEDWLLKAANNGIISAFYSLGYLYTLQSAQSNTVSYSYNDKPLNYYTEKEKESYYWFRLYSYYATPSDTSFHTFFPIIQSSVDSFTRVNINNKAYKFITNLYIKKYKEKDYSLAKDILFPLALANDSWAEYYMGQAYQFGLGVIKNDSIALNWYGRSASHNYIDAFYTIGDFYKYGTLGKKDIKKAIEYYKKGVEKGSGEAMYQLGWIHYEGTDIKQDYSEAFRLFLKASDKQHIQSQSMAGYMYEQGLGTDINQTIANSLYRMAAEKGNKVAQYNLGIVYELGKGTDINENEALIWYSKAANQGDPDAQYKTGYLYEKKNQAQNAIYWYELAAKSGSAEATEGLKRLKQ